MCGQTDEGCHVLDPILSRFLAPRPSALPPLHGWRRLGAFLGLQRFQTEQDRFVWFQAGRGTEGDRATRGQRGSWEGGNESQSGRRASTRPARLLPLLATRCDSSTAEWSGHLAVSGERDAARPSAGLLPASASARDRGRTLHRTPLPERHLSIRGVGLALRPLSLSSLFVASSAVCPIGAALWDRSHVSCHVKAIARGRPRYMGCGRPRGCGERLLLIARLPCGWWCPLPQRSPIFLIAPAAPENGRGVPSLLVVVGYVETAPSSRPDDLDRYAYLSAAVRRRTVGFLPSWRYTVRPPWAQVL